MFTITEESIRRNRRDAMVAAIVAIAVIVFGIAVVAAAITAAIVGAMPVGIAAMLAVAGFIPAAIAAWCEIAESGDSAEMHYRSFSLYEHEMLERRIRATLKPTDF